MQMDTIVPAGILNIFLKREAVARKCQIVPRNISDFKKCDIEAFFACRKFPGKLCGKEQVQLSGVDDIDGGEQAADFNLGTGSTTCATSYQAQG